MRKLNPFMPNGLLYFHSSGRSVSGVKGVWLLFIIIMFLEISVFDANSVDPDQTPRSAASDPGLHCLPMPFLWGARHKSIVYLGRVKRKGSFEIRKCADSDHHAHVQTIIRALLSMYTLCSIEASVSEH